MLESVQIVWDNSTIYTKEGLLGIINGLPLAVAVIDANRKVALANRATYEFVNKNEVELIGHVGGDAFGCIHHDDVPEGCGFGTECLKCKLRMTVKDTMENRKSHFMVETSMVFKLHGQRHLRITTQPLLLQGNEVVLLSIEDVTEAKKHEQIKLEKEKLSAVIHTTGAVCHEMNQPLMTIMGFSELLIAELAEGKIQESNVKEINEQAKRLGTITRKLMSITQYKTKGYLNSQILDIDAASEGINSSIKQDKEEDGR